MVRIRAWLERNELIFKAAASCIVAIIAGAWAIVNLVYPDFILPRLQPPKIQSEIIAREVGRTDQYTVHELSFKFTNSGINRIYVPSSYFLVKAYKVSYVHAREEQGKTEDEKKEDKIVNTIVTEYLKKLSQEERLALKAQASNYLAKKEWPKLLAKDDLSGETDLRTSFEFNHDSFLYVHLGRLIGLTEILDPGDVATGQVLLYVPSGYQALEVISSTILSKDKDVFSKYLFIGVPDERKGLLMLVLDGSKPIDPQISELRKTIEENIKSGYYAKAEEELLAINVVSETKRMQIHIPPEQPIIPPEQPRQAEIDR